jgi:competence protein ComEC
VISVGPNSYGHPGADTLNRLSAAGAWIWRTDERGTLVFASHGITYTVPGTRTHVFLSVVMREQAPPPASDLHITALSGLSAPEYVTIQNTGTGSQDTTGWTLVSVVGPQRFNFPAGYTLAPGAAVRIESYTGVVNNPPAILLWSTGAIWANTGDKAVLYNDVGTAIDSACYGTGCP